MNNNKNSFSIKLIYWLTNIVFVLITLMGIVAVVLNIMVYTNKFGNDLQLHILLPVKVDFLETGILQLNNQETKVELVEAIPRIHLFNTPTYIAKKIGFFLILMIAWTIFEVFTFRLFIKNVYNGNIFTYKNIALLKRLAYGLLGLWIFGIVYFRLGYHYLAKNLVFENVKISDDLPNYSGVLLTALLIWVLAHIFKKGLELKQETDLTI